MVLEEKINKKFERLKSDSNIGLKFLKDHRNISLKKKLKKKNSFSLVKISKK